MRRITFRQFRVAANGTSTQLTSIGTGTPAAEGIVHALVISADATGGTVSIYDDVAANAPSLKCQVTQIANVPFRALLDMQFKVGLTLVTAGFASPNVVLYVR